MTSPSWFERAMIRHFGSDPAISPPSDFAGFFDHMRRDGEAFICEPYLDPIRAIGYAMKIARKIGCLWHFEAVGLWHEKTVGVEFHPAGAKPTGSRARYRMTAVVNRAVHCEGAD